MRFPRPALQEYANGTAATLVTLAVLQYTGILSGSAGAVDWSFLLVVGLTLPVFTYLLTVVTANIEQLPESERMTRTRK